MSPACFPHQQISNLSSSPNFSTVKFSAMAGKVVLLNSWASMFGVRVQVALAEKGIDYEYREENLQDKSSLLLQMNPVHKKIPVLIHNGKPICESLVILQYIEETWPEKTPLLPSDPYQRAQARFWADYIDQKVPMAGKMALTAKGEELEAAKKDLIGSLKVLEGELGDKKFFGGGDNLGYVDVALVGFIVWFNSYEAYGNMDIKRECPKLKEWAKRCMEKPNVFKTLPDEDKVLGLVTEIRKNVGLA